MTAGTRRPLWVGLVVVAVAFLMGLVGRPGTREGPQSPPGNPAMLSVLSPPSDGSCLSRDRAMGIITSSGAPSRAEPPPFCTTRSDIVDWITAEDGTILRHYAFDAKGCLAAWEQAPCP